MALLGLNLLELCVRDVLGEFLLLRKCKEVVGRNSNHERGLLDGCEGSRDVVSAIARNVVAVKLAGDGDVAVCVESLNKLLALVTEIGLGRKKVVDGFFVSRVGVDGGF